jgi:hypothetical protein
VRLRQERSLKAQYMEKGSLEAKKNSSFKKYLKNIYKQGINL